MKKCTLIFIYFLFLLFLLPRFVFTQKLSQEELEFHRALRSYVLNKLTDFGRDFIIDQRFLIEQMRQINFEIRSRITNYDDVRAKYFESLQERVNELSALKERISRSGSSALLQFVNELQSRINVTINDGIIDFRRQKVFEDALQLLYLAEQMLNLDTGARVDNDPKISKGILESHNKFLSAFGEEKEITFTGSFDKKATIFDLFQEWKRTNIIEYKLRWTDVSIIKNKLINEGTGAEKDRMFKRELKSAILAFNYGYNDLADRFFEELMNTYDFITSKDDLYFYWAESNYNLGRYTIAKKYYREVVDTYPGSPFVIDVYDKLTRIGIHFNDVREIRKYYQEFEKTTAAGNPKNDDLRMKVALFEFNNEVYEKAVDILLKINSNSRYHMDSQYLLAQAYIGAQKMEEGEQILQYLVNNYSLQPNFRNNIMLKLGYICYEKRDYANAINYFDEIPGDFPLIDRVLIGYAWAYYKIELAKEKKNRDFIYAKKFLNILINDFFTSDYYLEANTLLGYIYQLELRSDNAIDQFDYVYRSRFTKIFSDNMITERDSIKNTIDLCDRLAEKALTKNNRIAYVRAKTVKSRLLNSYLRLSYSDMSSTGIAKDNELKRLNAQVNELERLKAIAVEREDEFLVNRIESLQVRLENIIREFHVESKISQLGYNYFDEYPVARKESLIEDENRKILALRENAVAEQEYITAKIIDLEAEIARARTTQDYKTLVHFEVQLDKFKQLKKQYDYMNTYAYNLELKDSNVNVDKWSDYGAFGIANVNFSIKIDKEEKISYYSDQINKINQILNSRKSILEHKVKVLEGEINVMTREVRRQERLREREELNRKFEETYFDTHTTEFEQSTTEPPSFDEEDIP